MTSRADIIIGSVILSGSEGSTSSGFFVASLLRMTFMGVLELLPVFVTLSTFIIIQCKLREESRSARPFAEFTLNKARPECNRRVNVFGMITLNAKFDSSSTLI